MCWWIVIEQCATRVLKFKLFEITLYKLFSPLLGVGWALVLVSFLCQIYYVMILAWSLYFLGASWQWPLPWATCNNEWNSESLLISSSTKFIRQNSFAFRLPFESGKQTVSAGTERFLSDPI